MRQKLGWNDLVVLAGLAAIGYGVYNKTDQYIAMIVVGAIAVLVGVGTTAWRAIAAGRQ